ncbi:hypothetical protein ACJJTC_008039 [Scirpophaga incertulas]
MPHEVGDCTGRRNSRSYEAGIRYGAPGSQCALCNQRGQGQSSDPNVNPSCSRLRAVVPNRLPRCSLLYNRWGADDRVNDGISIHPAGQPVSLWTKLPLKDPKCRRTRGATTLNKLQEKPKSTMGLSKNKIIDSLYCPSSTRRHSGTGLVPGMLV